MERNRPVAATIAAIIAVWLASFALAACGTATLPATAMDGQPAGAGAATATAEIASPTATTVAATPTPPPATPTATATRAPTPTPTATATPAPLMTVSPHAERFAIVPETSRAGYHVTAIRSDLPGHDNARDGFLDTELYPRVTFVPRRLEGLPDGPLAEGQDLAFKIVGDLTVRTATKEVTFDATGKVVGDTFTGTASAKIQLTAFGLEPPEELQLQVDDNVTLEVTLEARRAR